MISGSLVHYDCWLSVAYPDRVLHRVWILVYLDRAWTYGHLYALHTNPHRIAHSQYGVNPSWWCRKAKKGYVSCQHTRFQTHIHTGVLPKSVTICRVQKEY